MQHSKWIMGVVAAESSGHRGFASLFFVQTSCWLPKPLQLGTGNIYVVAVNTPAVSCILTTAVSTFQQRAAYARAAQASSET